MVKFPSVWTEKINIKMIIQTKKKQMTLQFLSHIVVWLTSFQFLQLPWLKKNLLKFILKREILLLVLADLISNLWLFLSMAKCIKIKYAYLLTQQF